MNTNGRYEGDKWKQVDWDQQGGDQAVSEHQKLNNYFQFFILF